MKNSKEIRIKSQEPKRVSVYMTPEVADRYRRFIGDNKHSYLHTSAALTAYMDAYKNGEIRPVMEV